MSYSEQRGGVGVGWNNMLCYGYVCPGYMQQSERGVRCSKFEDRGVRGVQSCVCENLVFFFFSTVHTSRIE